MSVALGNKPRFCNPAQIELDQVSAPRFYIPQILLPDCPSAISTALEHLKQAPQDVLVRLTGAGLLEAKVAQRLAAVMQPSFCARFQGMFLTGATRSVETDTGKAKSGVTEIGAWLEGACPDARFLGVVPSAAVEERKDGLFTVKREDGLEVITNPGNRLLLSSAKPTSYFWDAEWQRCLQLKQALNPRISVLISFDGGVATKREIYAWAEESLRDNNSHLVFILGGHRSRSTDLLAHKLNFVNAHPNVHLVGLSPDELQDCLLKIEALPKAEALVRARAA